MDRVIGLIDMDCFYAQVEQRERPEIWDTPVAVVQHAREGTPGGIIAVSYEARKFGVKRGMMIPEAKAKCPDLNVCFVPQGEHIDKADIQKYRDASAEVFEVLNTFDQRIIVERASVDEAFLDLTDMVDRKIVESGAVQLLRNITDDLSHSLPSTHLADGNDKGEAYDREEKLSDWLVNRCAEEISHLRLAIAAQTVEQIRARIREHTQFFCSGGIANNKMLAKLVCARHKPRQQTVIPFDFVPVIFEDVPVGDVRMLGGKLGHTIQDRLAVGTMGDLAAIPYEMIERHFGGQAQWISQLAKGLDDEPVKPRNNQLSIAVSKNFPGRNALSTVAEVRRWIDGLSKELSKRLVADKVKNKRTAENVIFGIVGETHTSKTLKIGSYSAQIIAEVVWSAAKTFNKAPSGSDQWSPPIFNLSMSASRFINGASVQSQNIKEWIEKRSQLCGEESGHFQPQPQLQLDKSVSKRSANVVMKIEEATNESGISASASYSAEETPGKKKKQNEAYQDGLDNRGWKTYDQEHFEVAASSNAVAAVESSDVGEISSAVFEELPEDIKAELAHFHKLDQARKLKAAAGKEQTSSRKSSRKTTTKEPLPRKNIYAFFKKDS